MRASWFNPSAAERLYVLEAGPLSPTRPTLVLIHGVGALGTKDFYPVLAALSRERHVLAVDLPGFGRSNGDDDDFGPERLVRSIDKVVRACTSKKVDVLGHSSGGALALLFSARRADAVRRLVVADAAGILLPQVLLEGQLHQRLSEAREKRPAGAKLAAILGHALIETLDALTPSARALGESGLLGTRPPILAATSLLDYNFGYAILEIRAETLLIWGKNDQVAPVRIAHLLNERIAQSELTFIEGAGHVPMRDQPELFASLVSGYLDQGFAERRAREGGLAAQALNSSSREGRCRDQDNVVFEGDYAQIEVLRCTHVWLRDVRAKRVVVRESEGRLDATEITQGLEVHGSQLSLTGGVVRGAIALSIRDSRLDIAGTSIVGDEVALDVHGDDNELVFSVTPLASANTARLMHGEFLPSGRVRM